MKSTGMIRRVDRLGRLVLPKEIRDTLGIKVGDGLEIKLDKDDIILKKYAKVQGIDEGMEMVFEQLYERYGNPILVCDFQHVLYSKQQRGPLYQGKHFSRMYKDVLLNKQPGIFEGIEIIPQIYEKQCYIYPVYKDERLCGSFTMIAYRTKIEDVDKNMLELASELVSKTLK